MTLIIDNYDSFTYNLYQYIGSINPDVKVVRNDKITIDEIKQLSPKRIVISPGPGYPDTAGISIDVIKAFSPVCPILGVCLGHQAIAQAFGCSIVRAPKVFHGKPDSVKINNKYPIFKGLPEGITVGRYHSLVIDESTMNEELEVIAKSGDGSIMAIKHREYETYGIQFHPESILTPDGMAIIKNFMEIKGGLKND